jgi:hypothetical protein
MTTLNDLESMAAAADLSNAESISKLTDAVLTYPHFHQIPSGVVSLLKTRAELAETKYLQQMNPGVREEDIVTAVNEIASALRLPDHARTTRSQIREIRIRALATYPHLMGRHLGRKDASGRLSLSESLSPLQATHLLLCLVDVKFTLPQYQLTPAEWEAEHQYGAKTYNTGSKAILTVRSNNSPRTHDLYAALTQGIAGISDADGLTLAMKTAKHLGIE